MKEDYCWLDGQDLLEVRSREALLQCPPPPSSQSAGLSLAWSSWAALSERAPLYFLGLLSLTIWQSPELQGKAVSAARDIAQSHVSEYKVPLHLLNREGSPGSTVLAGLQVDRHPNDCP